MTIKIDDLTMPRTLNSDELAQVTGGVKARTVKTRDGRTILVGCTGVPIGGNTRPTDYFRIFRL